MPVRYGSDDTEDMNRKVVILSDEQVRYLKIAGAGDCRRIQRTTAIAIRRSSDRPLKVSFVPGTFPLGHTTALLNPFTL
jgi:hypothetical protein